MKKIMCLFLMALMALSLAGCGGNTQGKSENGTLAPQKEASYNRDEGAKVFENPQIGDVLIDNELVKISYNGIDVHYYEDLIYQRVYVNVTVEAKKGFRLVSSGDNEVNEFIKGIAAGELWGELFKTGQTKEGRLPLGISNGLKEMDPSAIKRIKIGFAFGSYSTTSTGEKLGDETIVIYPNGKQEIKPQISLDNEKSKVVYDKDGIQFIVTNWRYKTHYKGDKYIYYYLCVVNNTNKEFHYDIEHFVKEADQENSGNNSNGYTKKIPPYSVYAQERYTDLAFIDDIVPPQLTIKMTGEILEDGSTQNGTSFEIDEYVINMSDVEK